MNTFIAMPFFAESLLRAAICQSVRFGWRGIFVREWHTVIKERLAPALSLVLAANLGGYFSGLRRAFNLDLGQHIERDGTMPLMSTLKPIDYQSIVCLQ